MLSLGNSLIKQSKRLVNLDTITDSLVLKHKYDAASVVPISDGAVYFDGTDDYIDLGGTFNNTEHSISAWVWFPDDSDNKTIFDSRDGNDDGIRLYVSTSEQILYQINGVDGNYTTSITTNTWNHIAATNDGTTSKIYLNGVLVETADTSGETISVSTNAKIGARNYSSLTAYFQGYMCNLGVWSSALTQAQIKSIMNKRYTDLTSSETTNLVSWWSLDSTARDSFGSNHGTLS